MAKIAPQWPAVSTLFIIPPPNAVAGLWCVNAGHGRREITQAVASQLETLGW